MTSRKSSITAVVGLFVFTAVAFGQGPRNGTAGASQLLIPQGASYLSGGGATASVDGIEAVYWNPAGLARSSNQIEAIFARRNYIADIGINFIAASMRLGNLGTFGISARTFDIGEINTTTIYAPGGTGEKFSPTVFVIGASYAKLVSDRTSIGLNLNAINEGFTGVSASGLTVDVGVQYSSFLNIPGLSVGVALKNFGAPMQYDGSALWIDAPVTGSNRDTEWYKVTAGKFDMPFNMDIGTSYKLELGASAIDLGFTFENNNAGQDEYRFFTQFSLGNFAAIRAALTSSVAIEDDESTDLVDESDLEYMFAGTSLGGSLNLQAVTGMDITLDYAYIATKFFDDNQVFSLRFGI
jgi:hypothetical protein